ncbi:MAG: class I SAM-dependent methyltransferase [Myxococcota bacterium]
MNEFTFTGERLHEGDGRFVLDIARHHAAYQVALDHSGGGRVLDLGCGSGHGTSLLAAADSRVFGFDRVFPDAASRDSGGHFVLGTLEAIPLRPASFDLVASFQVIEHLVDPSFYVDAIADLLRPSGLALITTPNVLTSDGVNPFHVHEYRAYELAGTLRRRFADVEIRGISPTDRIRQVLAERSRKIRRIMRLDPLRIRDRLPGGLIHWLFARFAMLVRQPSAEDEPAVSWRDFPVGPADDDCLDLLALCRRPR